MTETEMIQALIANASMLYGHSLHGSPPYLGSPRSIMENPRPGDLVFEDSTRSPEGVGYLICTRQEFIPFTEEEGGYTDTATYIERPDGQLQRWRNCRFLRILPDLMSRLRESDPPRTEWAEQAKVRHGLDG